MAMRIRVKFEKTEPMRFTSHLDLYRAWERLLRRAGVQLQFSQGYNPRPKLQLAAPLALGITSRCEIIDFWLIDQHIELAQLKSKLIAAQPPGIEILSLEKIDPTAPPLQRKVAAAQYEAILLDPVPGLDPRVEQLLAAKSIIRQRRGKSYDLRPQIEELTCLGGDTQVLKMLMVASEGNTGRPEEVLLALGIQPENTRIQRTKLLVNG
jgi:radical SAM-linked protein